ncbi:hypothetical protein SANTM175S_03518 [Streptomyces antimycoticus]
MPAIDALRPLRAHVRDFLGEGAGMGLDLGVGYGFGDDNVRFGHVKVFLDGSLLGATAAVTESFAGTITTPATCSTKPQAYRERALAAYRAGVAARAARHRGRRDRSRPGPDRGGIQAVRMR